MSENITFKKATEETLQAANKVVIINDYQGDVKNISQRIETNGMKAFSSTDPDYDTNKLQLQFQLPTGDVMYNQHTSYLSYTLKITTGFTAPGKLTLRNHRWEFQEYRLVTAVAGGRPAHYEIDSTKQPVAIATGPNNSMFILDNSYVNYGNFNNNSEYIWRNQNFVQMKLEDSYQDTHNQTWFGGKEGGITIDFLPYTMAAGVKTYVATTNYGAGKGTGADVIPAGSGYVYNTASEKYYVTVYKEFKIPFVYLNQAFDVATPLLPYNTLRHSFINIELNMTQWSIGKMLGTEVMFPQYVGTTAANGIIDAHLIMYGKSCASITQDMINNNKIIKMNTQNYRRFLVISNNNYYENQGSSIQISHQSSNDLMFLVNSNDSNADDSAFVHGISSFFTGEQIINILNSGESRLNCNYFYDFNIQIGGGPNIFDQHVLRSIEQYRHLTLASLNMIDNYYGYGAEKLSGSKLEWALFNQILLINFEGFNQDLMGQDLINDGFDSQGKGVQIQWAIHNYDDGNYDENTKAYDPASTTLPTDSKIPDTGYIIECYEYYDDFQFINTSNNDWRHDEKIQNYK